MTTKDPAKADSAEEATQAKAESSPHPDDSRKPDAPTDLVKPAWGYIFKRSLSEFGKDQCTDIAAALTFFAVLAVFPALLALVSILGLFGQAQTTTETVLNVVANIAPEAERTIGPTVEQLASSDAAGLTFVIGLLGAIWSASAFVTAFSRALNRVYEVEEGRPFWKLRPIMLLITVVVLLLVVFMALLLILSGPVAEAIGGAIGLGPTALTVWNIVKWPVMVFFAVLTVAILYYATPNLQQPKFKWVSVGSIIALLVLAVTTVAFSFYVVNFGNYQQTYGAIAGVIIFLLWLWLANLSLLFGAEVDAELERGRELQAGIKAEETVQLPPRDTKAAQKKRDKQLELVDEGRELRQKYGRDHEDRNHDVKERSKS